MADHKIPFFLILKDEDIDDIMVAALEGGVNHWVTRRVYPTNDDYKGAEYASHALSKGATLLISDEDGMHELTLDKFLEGYLKWAEWRIKERGNLLDVEHIDAGEADMIVQFALFGELVYSD